MQPGHWDVPNSTTLLTNFPVRNSTIAKATYRSRVRGLESGRQRAQMTDAVTTSLTCPHQSTHVISSAALRSKTGIGSHGRL
jgi:hypothetical protein